MKSLILILLVVGLILITTGYTRNHKNCPPTKIEYRYIPRNFYEEQVTETKLTNTYSDMFNKADTWSRYPVGNVDTGNDNNLDNLIDKYDQPDLDLESYDD